MKKILFSFLLLSLVSCTKNTNKPSERVKKYYKGFENSNYEQIKNSIFDSLTITEGDYIMKHTPKSYYNHFKWDSVFKPTYKLVSLENQDNKVLAMVSVNSTRLEFLKNNPLTCKYQFYFKSGKIAKIENLDCIGVDWKIWRKERDSLTNWIKRNHSELDGFINDLTMKGGLDYLKAIEFYKNRKGD